MLLTASQQADRDSDDLMITTTEIDSMVPPANSNQTRFPPTSSSQNNPIAAAHPPTIVSFSEKHSSSTSNATYHPITADLDDGPTNSSNHFLIPLTHCCNHLLRYRNNSNLLSSPRRLWT
mmetsp:Transcript_27382/g.37739  ORF Transcript_27382/g.37739 Transcript_27382/m.37739 type:complete len:120 (-) Transcript_27382:442-801(-)